MKLTTPQQLSLLSDGPSFPSVAALVEAGKSALIWLHSNNFIGPVQTRMVADALRGEERRWFAEKMLELRQRVESMPCTYQQDGLGDQAIAHLRYFCGGQATCWITEKDKGSPDDTPAERQWQAFGLADLFGDGGETGYICLPEWLANGAELDFHFQPAPLSEIRKL